MNAEVDKLRIAKLVNVSTSLNNFLKKVDDSDVDKLQIVPTDLEKKRNLVKNEVVKNTKFNTIKTK